MIFYKGRSGDTPVLNIIVYIEEGITITIEKGSIEIPLLNSILDAMESSNMGLELYFDILYMEGGTEPSIDRCLCLARLISNLVLFMELSVKWKLICEHWAFVFDDIDKATEERFDNGDFVSVNFRRGIKRLKNICSLSTTLTNCLELYKLRNKIQHFTLTSEPIDLTLKIISYAIEEMGKFVLDHMISEICDDKELVEDFNEHVTRLKLHGIELASNIKESS